MCAISLGVQDLALRLANKCTTPLPEDSETEYSPNYPEQKPPWRDGVYSPNYPEQKPPC